MEQAKAEKTVSQLEDVRRVIQENALSLLHILNGTNHPDLTPRLRRSITDLVADLQALEKSGGSGPAAVEQHPPPPREPPQAEKDAPKKRRRASKLFDYIVLEGIKQKDAWRPLVGQDDLVSLGMVADQNTKKDSLVSKLNRWKNDKRWVEWQDPTSLTLTPEGERRRKDLLIYVRAQGHEAAVKRAFKAAWDHDMTPV